MNYVWYKIILVIWFFNIKHMFGGEMVEEYIQKIYEELLKEGAEQREADF